MNVAVSVSRLKTASQTRSDQLALCSVTFAILHGEFVAVVVSSRSARMALRAILDGSEQPVEGSVFIASSSVAVFDRSTAQHLQADALESYPRLLIADEPTEGLDDDAGARTMASLRAFDDGRRAIVLLTQDGGLASRHARRIIVISEDRVVRDADAALHQYGR